MEEFRAREDNEQIDLYDYVKVIWRWRWMIIIGVIVLILVAILASYLVRSYESLGVLRLSASDVKIFLPQYKTYSETFLAPELFLAYVKTHNVVSKEKIAYLEKKLKTIDSLQKSAIWIMSRSNIF